MGGSGSCILATLVATDCESWDRGRSCSFPGGMECVRAETTHIKILAWHFSENRGEDGTRGNKSDVRTEAEMGEVMKRCVCMYVFL